MRDCCSGSIWGLGLELLWTTAEGEPVPSFRPVGVVDAGQKFLEIRRESAQSFPVKQTIARALPDTTRLPANIIHLASKTGSPSCEGTETPCRKALLFPKRAVQQSSEQDMILQSAGTISPFVRDTRSPGTTHDASMHMSLPLRRTLALSATQALNFVIASVCLSHGKRQQSHAGQLSGDASSFGPATWSDVMARSASRPCSRLVTSFSATRSAGRECHSQFIVCISITREAPSPATWSSIVPHPLWNAPLVAPAQD
mmetsp:Transcript_10782/g.19979  ORF Transcript_10782/g.19979 Transcript_10782/m.19979 type:complete len:257 (+) Transcript_10782:887-1657(+)